VTSVTEPPIQVELGRNLPSANDRARVTAWKRMRVWFCAHAVDDLYQGLVPAAIPFFVLDRHYSYAAASGLALAATVGSAVPQLLIGLIADRRPVLWMSPLGLILAGLGVGLSGLVHPYGIVFALLLLSGLGVALFHPPAGRDARLAAQHSATAMSYFALQPLCWTPGDYAPSRSSSRRPC
jgi:FSR family fosmidomycin resistance protein-like MFS transporter